MCIKLCVFSVIYVSTEHTIERRRESVKERKYNARWCIIARNKSFCSESIDKGMNGFQRDKYATDLYRSGKGEPLLLPLIHTHTHTPFDVYIRRQWNKSVSVWMLKQSVLRHWQRNKTQFIKIYTLKQIYHFLMWTVCFALNYSGAK